MRYLNIYYIGIVAMCIVLWKISDGYQEDIVSFYGFAETKEMQINLNHSIVIDHLNVTPGELVNRNTPILGGHRIKTEEQMDEEIYKIEELQAKEVIWRADKESTIEQLQAKKKLEIERISNSIRTLKSKKNFNERLYQGLDNVEAPKNTHQPLTEKVKALQREAILIKDLYDKRIRVAQKKLKHGKSPYKIAIERLKAERAFEKANQKKYINIKAPSDGIVGNVNCKEGEHIPSFQTLLTFYEPNPTLVKGYVQERMSIHVSLQDSFLVRSIRDPSLICFGTTTGLGSRIVEIPERMRKIPDFKVYGREILVTISSNNQFLQKEKVVLEFINPSKELLQIVENQPEKTLVTNL